MTALPAVKLKPLQWSPHLPPVEMASATAAQLEAMKVTPSAKSVSAYVRTLAHDPESYVARTELFNAIMYAPGGLARVDRELGALAASMVNGCGYCANVHARRHAQLSGGAQTVSALWCDRRDRLSGRDRAIVDFAEALSAMPPTADRSHVDALREAGFREAEIVDLVHAVAIFCWANRLMHPLGHAGPEVAMTDEGTHPYGEGRPKAPARNAPMSADPEGLALLEARLRYDLECLELPSKSWVPARTFAGARVWDVMFVGAGMCGLAGAARLQMAGVDNIVLYDAAPEGLEGPWETFARMNTLRSPKTLSGPALGLPSLTFRSWYEFQFGSGAWQRMEKIPKGQWMDYLRWYRRVLELPVVNETRMTGLADAGDGLIAVDLADDAGGRTEHCRHLVVATGRSGLGGGVVPDFLEKVDRRFWAHSADTIDFAALGGKRVIVIGAGASAMDNAATALEAGASGVDMLIRRKRMPRINKMTGIGSQGVVHGMRALPDAWKYRFNAYVNEQQVPAPRSSTLRVTRHDNARLFLGCPVTAVEMADGHIVARTPLADFQADFIIAATGFRNDFAGRDEFAAIAPHIRTWNDGVYAPEMGAAVPCMVEAPYLGDAFEFRQKRPGACPMLERIHCFNDAAMLSHGKLSGDVPAISAGADRLMRGIAAALFVADRQAHFDSLKAYSTPELLGDEWVDAAPDLKEGAP